MILKETILSAFDDRGTLLKWLEKVEEALKNAVLTDFSVEQISETEIKFKFTFENGDFIESPVLTLPRGEKGEQGAQGAQGKAASIRIGAVATGSPNTLANVSNSGTPEDAVLNFVIPQGEQGEQGEQGPAGPEGPAGPQGPAGPAGESTDGFGSITEMIINDITAIEDVIAGAEGIAIYGTSLATSDNETFEIPTVIHIPLTGSDSIVLDVDETGTKLTIRLDAEIIAKLSRALVTPMSAPESVALVGVDSSNAQTMLTLGSGLSVSDGVISASGGGGTSESGTKLYRHRFTTARGFKFDAICNHANAGTDTSDYIPAAYLSGYPSQMTLALYINDGLCVQAKENSDYVLQFFYYNGTSISIAASTGDMPESTGEVEVIEL